MNNIKQDTINIYIGFLRFIIENKISNKIHKSGKKKNIEVDYYLNMILFVLISGITWENLKFLNFLGLKCNYKSIENQFFKGILTGKREAN